MRCTNTSAVLKAAHQLVAMGGVQDLLEGLHILAGSVATAWLPVQAYGAV